MNVCPQCGNAFDDPVEVCPVDNFKLISIDSSGADPMVGKLLDGRYRLICKVGEGGMGSIYRSVHTEMSRTCAIKLLTALSPGKDDAIARFKREAKNSSRIDNVHAVTIYDFGQAEDGMLFLAMEFIDGTPLSRVLAEQRVLPIERVIHLTDQIAEALGAAHQLGIVHRDLKPDNIMITRKGAETDYVKVLDFGIAKTVADDQGGENLTKTGFVLGTPVYMSPEQLLGEKLDPRSDVYSLAIIVYEMLSGRLPFEGDNPQAVMMKRVMSDPIRLRAAAPSVSESVERAVMAGLARDRDARTPNAAAFAADLGRALYTGTQIMGGVVTRNLSEPRVARATNEWTGYGATPESGPAFTHEAESGLGSSFEKMPAWAATELTVPPAAAPAIQAPPGIQAKEAGPVAVAPNAAVVSKPRPRTGKWLWGGGALALVVIAAILYLLLSGSGSGFTLIVKGAPEGSEISVNGTRRNAEAADGGLKLTGLDPGEVKVQVSHGGYADFVTTITGAKGEVQTCEARLLPEIDYNGKMVPVPAGDFLMGDDGHADERPAHKLTQQAFYIDKYEVSNAQYKKFCDATGHAPPPNPSSDPNYFTSKPDFPVLGVTIADALAYADWAGKRLPTEEEWEKAAGWDAQAQKKRQYPWGDDFASGRANIGTGRPVVVAESNGDRSPYGVCNMAGNACEWTMAAWQPYEGNKSPTLDFNPDEIVVRGGTFLPVSTVNEARTSYRNHLPKVFPKGAGAPVGIRCVVPADDPRIQPLLRERNR